MKKQYKKSFTTFAHFIKKKRNQFLSERNQNQIYLTKLVTDNDVKPYEPPKKYFSIDDYMHFKEDIKNHYWGN